MKQQHCDSCEVLSINGVVCHERGCPDAWKSRPRECKECGRSFIPEELDEWFCDEECSAEFHGWEVGR